MRRSSRVALLLLLLPVSPGATPRRRPGVELRDVTVTTQPDSVTVIVKTSREAKYQAELMDHPYRLVVDFEDTELRMAQDPAERRTPSRSSRSAAASTGAASPGSSSSSPATSVTRSARRATGWRSSSRPATRRAARRPPAACQGRAARSRPPRRPARAKPAASPRREPSRCARDGGRSDDAGQAEPASRRLPRSRRRRPSARRRRPPPPRADHHAAPASGARLISLDFKDADVVNLLRILAAESSTQHRHRRGREGQDVDHAPQRALGPRPRHRPGGQGPA